MREALGFSGLVPVLIVFDCNQRFDRAFIVDPTPDLALVRLGRRPLVERAYPENSRDQGSYSSVCTGRTVQWSLVTLPLMRCGA